MLTILVIILVLGVLILAHEFGHFITAKKTGVKVEEFGIGFPPRIWSKLGKDGVKYSINWIPLGGFVKLKGESGEQKDDKDSFSHKPVRVRALIISAGVTMNILLALVLFSVGFMFGLPAVISDDQINNPSIKDKKVQIASIVQNSPANLAGIEIGDQVVKIDQTEITTVKQMQDYLAEHQDKELVVSLKRQNNIREVKVTPEFIKNFSENQKVLGVTLVLTGIVQHNFFTAWYYGTQATINLLIMIIVAFYNLIKDIFMGLGVSIDLRGPVGVAIMTGQVVSLGWIYVLQFSAMLSLNLAVLNFFPFPALDGGRFLFLLIEKIRRKPNNQQIENLIHNIGFTILILLVLMVTYRDIVHYGTGFIEKVKSIFS